MSNSVNIQDWKPVTIGNPNKAKITGKTITDKDTKQIQGKFIDTEDGDFVVKNMKKLPTDKVQLLIQIRLNKDNNLSQENLAKRLSIPVNDIKAVEQNKEINLNSYQKIQRFLEKYNIETKSDKNNKK